MSVHFTQTDTRLILIPDTWSVADPDTLVILSSTGEIMASIQGPVAEHADFIRDLIADDSAVQFKVLFTQDDREAMSELFPEMFSLAEVEEILCPAPIESFMVVFMRSTSVEDDRDYGPSECADKVRGFAEHLEAEHSHPVEFTPEELGASLAFFHPKNQAGVIERTRLRVISQ